MRLAPIYDKYPCLARAYLWVTTISLINTIVLYTTACFNHPRLVETCQSLGSMYSHYPSLVKTHG